jgi:hypothetical protein
VLSSARLLLTLGCEARPRGSFWLRSPSSDDAEGLRRRLTAVEEEMVDERLESESGWAEISVEVGSRVVEVDGRSEVDGVVVG